MSRHKIGWKHYEAIINWLLLRKKEGREVTPSDLRKQFGLFGREANNRIFQLHRWGVIKPTQKKGIYEISSIDKEKLESIHRQYVPNGGRLQVFLFKGEELTLMEIYQREKPAVSLNHFTIRMRRGWTIEMALMPSSKKC